MALNENDVLSYYDGCDYWPTKGYPPRPKELNVPLIIKKYLEPEELEELCQNVSSRTMTIPLDLDSHNFIVGVQLHESLFHFYKAFYNYLAARALYFGGMQHWIEITLYYAKFYLARSVTILLGKQAYSVNRSHRNFVSAIADALKSNSGKVPNSYRVEIIMDMIEKTGELVVNTGRVNSHRDVWEDYKILPVDSAGFFRLFNTNEDDMNSLLNLVKQRNEENYSFDGYWHLDFNLSAKEFDHNYAYYNYIKNHSDVIYDLESSDFLMAFSSQFRLFRKLNVNALPIETQKFSKMIDYNLPDSKGKQNLLLLCNEGFPTKDLFSEDGEVFFDEQDRCL